MTRPRESVRRIVASGIAAWERDDYEGALEVFRGVLAEHQGFADVHNNAGLCLAMLGRAEEALPHFEAALEINPRYAEAHLNRGIILNELGRHDAADEAIARARELDLHDSVEYPSELGNRLATTLGELGDLYMVAEQPAAAVRHYQTALEIRPRFIDIRGKLAEALIHIEELEEARDELQVILHARPGLVGSRVRLGVVYHRLGDDEAAIAEWKRCLEDDPDDMRPRAYLTSVGVDLPEEAAGA